MGRPCKYEWNEKRIKAMMKYYSIGDYNSLFEELGFNNIDIIRHKAMELCLKSDYYDFSEEQLQFIRDNYLTMSYEEIGNHIGKTKSSINTKINRLGLVKVSEWTEKDFELLKEKYPHYTNKYLSEKIFIGRKPHSIRTMALKMGLHKTKEKGLKFYDKKEMIDGLFNATEKIGRTPKTEELVSLGLPSEKSYRRYFDSYRNACDLAGVEIMSSIYGRAKIYYSKNNDKCFSKSELFITNFFIDNNISYLKDGLYNKICNNNYFGKTRYDWMLEDNSIVEFFGMPEKDFYFNRMEFKRNLCKENKLNLIEIFYKDLSKLHTIFDKYII